MTEIARRGAGWLAGLLLVVLATLATISPAEAGPGVRLSHGEIELAGVLLAGYRYEIADLVVGNPGDVPSSYQMTTAALAGHHNSIPPQWMSFHPAEFALEPGANQPITVSLEIPGDARLGAYAGLLAAQMKAPGTGDGVTASNVGGGAAAKLQFEVKAPSLIHALVNTVRVTWRDMGAWQYLVYTALVSAALFALLRRFSIRIELRRSSTDQSQHR